MKYAETELKPSFLIEKAKDILALFIDKLPMLFYILIVAIVGYFVYKIAVRMTVRFLKNSKINITFYNSIIQVVKIIVMILITAAIVSILGLSSAFTAIIGSFGLAISLALKDNIANYASGLIILSKGEFGVGDFVEIDDNIGKIEAIGLDSTEIITIENKHVFIPNALITKTSVVNSSSSKIRRIAKLFKILTMADLVSLDTEIRAKLESSPLVINDKPMTIGIANIGTIYMDLEIVAWVKNKDIEKYKYWINEEMSRIIVKEKLNEKKDDL